MLLIKIRKYIEHGLLQEARSLIEQNDIMVILQEEMVEQDEENQRHLPLLITCTLVNNENSAYNLCVLLIEKGYNVNFKDRNGLCALNYAIIFERVTLVELFMKCFDFNLDLFHDCYNNTLLHYVYAVNNKQIVYLYTNIYKKYYAWDLNMLFNIKNFDGLSVLDLYNYNQTMTKSVKQKRATVRSMSVCKPSKYHFYCNQSFSAQVNAQNTTFGKIPNESFFKISNPYYIAKRIKKIYDSKLTIKVVSLIDKNTNNCFLQTFDKQRTNNQVFQMDFLLRIKKYNRVKSAITTPLILTADKSKPEENNINSRPKTVSQDSFRKVKYNRNESIPKNNTECWKKDIPSLLIEYANIYTPSYRKGITHIINNNVEIEQNLNYETSLSNKQTN